MTRETNLPVAVSIIYPESRLQRDTIEREFRSAPQNWFTSDLYNQVHKNQVDVPVGPMAKRVPLISKPPKQEWIIIIAEFGQRDANNTTVRPNQYTIIILDDQAIPGPKRREHVRIFPGFMERLRRAPPGY